MDSEQQMSSPNKRHDLNAQYTDSMPRWMALKAMVLEDPDAELVLEDTEFLIKLSKITAEVMVKMAYPMAYEIQRRLQSIPISHKREWLPGDNEGLRDSIHFDTTTFDTHYLPVKPPQKRGRPASSTQSPSRAKKRGRPASSTQSPSQAKKRGRQACQSEPCLRKKLGRPPKAKAPPR
jgi:hypothetical protein